MNGDRSQQYTLYCPECDVRHRVRAEPVDDPEQDLPQYCDSCGEAYEITGPPKAENEADPAKDERDEDTSPIPDLESFEKAFDSIVDAPSDAPIPEQAPKPDESNTNIGFDEPSEVSVVHSDAPTSDESRPIDESLEDLDFESLELPKPPKNLVTEDDSTMPPEEGPTQDTQRGSSPPPPPPDESELTPAQPPSRPPTAERSSETEEAPDEHRYVSLVTIAAAALLGAGFIGYSVYTYWSSRAPTDQTAKPPPKTEVADAIERAKNRVARPLNLNFATKPGVLELARKVNEMGQTGRARRLYLAAWKTDKADKKLAVTVARTLLDSGNPAKSRRIAVEAARADKPTSGLRKVFNDTIRAETKSGDYEFQTIEAADFDGAELRRIEEGSVIVALQKDGAITHLFKPQQGPPGKSRWRADIASWRLCRTLGCTFALPEATPTKLPKKTLRTLVGEADSQTFEALEDQITWTDPGDGGDASFVRGSLTEWFSDAEDWPMEQVDTWLPWVDVDTPRHRFDDDLDKYYKNAPSIGVGSFARQLSDMLVFDFLTNNWHRFDERPELHGQNTQLRPSGLVGLANDRAFESRKSTRVQGRFEWVSRFNPDLIAALELVKRQPLLDYLFPDPPKEQQIRFEIMWEQRNSVLDRIRELRDEYGDRIYFEF